MNPSSKIAHKPTLAYRDLKPGIRFRVLEWSHLNPVEIVASKRNCFVVVEVDDPSPRKWSFRIRKEALRKQTLVAI